MLTGRTWVTQRLPDARRISHRKPMGVGSSRCYQLNPSGIDSSRSHGYLEVKLRTFQPHIEAVWGHMSIGHPECCSHLFFITCWVQNVDWVVWSEWRLKEVSEWRFELEWSWAGWSAPPTLSLADEEQEQEVKAADGLLKFSGVVTIYVHDVEYTNLHLLLSQLTLCL